MGCLCVQLCQLTSGMCTGTMSTADYHVQAAVVLQQACARSTMALLLSSVYRTDVVLPGREGHYSGRHGLNRNLFFYDYTLYNGN